MEIYLLKKGSKGLSGSLQNAEHHAPGAKALIHATLATIEELSPYIARWGQGHNIHVIESHDGRRLAFRPWHAEDKWGIEVKLQVSRSVEVPIMTFDKITKTTRLFILMRDFLKVKENFYGRAEEQYDKKEYKFKFVEAEYSIGPDEPWKPVTAAKMPAYNKDRLRCLACGRDMTWHRGPTPHFEHKASQRGFCPAYGR